MGKNVGYRGEREVVARECYVVRRREVSFLLCGAGSSAGL